MLTYIAGVLGVGLLGRAAGKQQKPEHGDNRPSDNRPGHGSPPNQPPLLHTNSG